MACTIGPQTHSRFLPLHGRFLAASASRSKHMLSPNNIQGMDCSIWITEGSGEVCTRFKCSPTAILGLYTFARHYCAHHNVTTYQAVSFYPQIVSCTAYLLFSQVWWASKTAPRYAASCSTSRIANPTYSQHVRFSKPSVITATTIAHNKDMQAS